MADKRVFIYVRVSTQEQAEEGYSLGEQEERLKKYSEAMGWTVMKVYNDGGYSGGNMERPALMQMIADIESNGTDIVLVDKLDRLSRSQFDTLYLIKKVFNENNVAFVSRAEAFDTSTPFGRAMVGILAVFAELERERIKERMSDGQRGRIKEGLFKGGHAVSFGYDYDPEQGILVPNEYEAMIVKEIFEMIINRTPFRTISNILNEKGYLTKNKCKWLGQTIRQMATNQTYIGMQQYRGEYVPAKHEPLISMEDWNKVQKIMDERSITNEIFKQGRHYTAPLSGMCYCGKCGAKFHYKLWYKEQAVYVCYSRSKSTQNMIKDPNCKNRVYKTQELEQAVYEEIRKLKSDALYLDKLCQKNDPTERIETISKQISGINNQISKLLDLYSLGSIDMDSIKQKVDALSEEKRLLETELDILEHEKPVALKEDIYRLVDMVEAAIEENESSNINSMISELIDYISINDEEVRIHWRF